MSKYQEALKRLKQETAPNTYCADFNKEECISILQELVDQQSEPTLSECIKEWEERGFEVKWNNENQLKISNYILGILIDKHSKDILIYDSYSYATSQYLSFELHHLLSKTLKALEVEEND